MQNIHTKVANTALPNFVVVNSDTIEDDRFIVQIYVEKSKLIKEYNTELSLLDGQIVNNYNNYIESTDILKKRRYIQQVVNLAEQSKLLAFILSGLDYSVNLNGYINNIIRYEEQLEKINKQINFKIIGEDLSIKKAIEQGLNDSGFNVQNGGGNENTVTIIFLSNDISKVIFEENIVKTNINLQVKNFAENTVYSNIIAVGGSSIISLDEAKRVAINSLSQKFKKEGILQYLGL
jgi:hypothetical protein